MTELVWKRRFAGKRLVADGVEFRVLGALPPPPDARHLVVHKSRAMIETIAAVIEDVRPRSMVEIGVLGGGSTAMLAQLARPEKLVAIEFSPDRAAALDGYIAANSMEDRVKPYFGVDQADRETVERIIEDEFDSALDLVIDDASHNLLETRESFNLLFPRLRPGGVFMIEDWNWSHLVDATPDNRGWPTGEPLTPMIFDLVVACGRNDGTVASVVVEHAIVRVVRGAATLDRRTFELTSDEPVHG